MLTAAKERSLRSLQDVQGQSNRSNVRATDVVQQCPIALHSTASGVYNEDKHDFLLGLGHRRGSVGTYVYVSANEADKLPTHLRNVYALPNTRRALTKPASHPPYKAWYDALLLRRSNDSHTIVIKIYCTTDPAAGCPNKYALDATTRALSYYFPSADLQATGSQYHAQSFYDVVHTPNPGKQPPPSIQHPAVQTELYPFQKRAVSWMLARERVYVTEDSQVADIPDTKPPIPLSFSQHEDLDGRPFYASSLLKAIVRDADDADSLHRHLHGGILSEEMGLGKTVELIDLLCLHRRTANLGEMVRDPYSSEAVKVSAATLIVTPPAILDQWISEIKAHAPSLKVLHYTGVKSTPKNIANTLIEQDVVVTTYTVLAAEIHYADDKPKRDLRHEKKYVARRSPLVKILWWRVCLDEAQMIESGVSSAAKVALRIPRCNAWAVTGTPLKGDINDLLGLLIFLRYEPFDELRVWGSMRHHPEMFRRIFSTIALRHTKAQVRNELQLPPQKRIIVTIPFTAIEEQHYKQLFDEMCADIGLDRFGAPTQEDWDPESDSVTQKMRQWLTRLRQTCLHPEVGERNKRALGRRNGPLRTVEEVLQVMVDQNEAALRTEERSAIMATMTQGHIYSFTQGVDKQLALDQYLQAMQVATTAYEECSDQFQEEAKLLGKSMEDLEHLDVEDEKSDRLIMHRNRVRNALELRHACIFFVATAYYQVKMQKTGGDETSPEYQDLEKAEVMYYDAAKDIRKEILRDITETTQRLIASTRATQERTRLIPMFSFSSNYGGIESQKVFRAVDQVGTLMNRQSDQMQEWRSKLAALLSENLLDQEEADLTGEEYEATLKNQDDQYVYLFILRASVAERQEMIDGRVNALVYHEVKEAAKLAEENKGHNPELTKYVLQARQSLLPRRGEVPKLPVNQPPSNKQSITPLIAELRGMINSLKAHANQDIRGSDRAKKEASILEDELKGLQKIIKDQSDALKALEKDVDLFRDTMNKRLEYYRRQQAISDTVQPYQEVESETLNAEKFKHEQRLQQRQTDKANALRTKRKFLHHLKNQKEGREERRPCTICLQPFETGVITICAHEFCKECISIWMTEHRSCPMCKKALRSSDLHNITYKPRQMEAQEEQQSASPSSYASESSSRNSIYSSISEEALDEIKIIDLPSSWGSKIDSIARHLLYLRANEPGAKTVLFSQYRDFLDVLGNALERCKVGFSEIRAKNGIKRFKEDPTVECFFLHAKADSSGLNLVNATHVILCEPLINTAVELQAISRVHRIGQRQPTTVWMYIVKYTVEEAIYDISVDRRLKHLGQKSNAESKEVSRAGTPALESKLDAANSVQLQSAPLSKLMTKGASGGEYVVKDDLWSCLFGKVRAESDDDATREIQEVLARDFRANAADERNIAGPS